MLRSPFALQVVVVALYVILALPALASGPVTDPAKAGHHAPPAPPACAPAAPHPRSSDTPMRAERPFCGPTRHGGPGLLHRHFHRPRG